MKWKTKYFRLSISLLSDVEYFLKMRWEPFKNDVLNMLHKLQLSSITTFRINVFLMLPKLEKLFFFCCFN